MLPLAVSERDRSLLPYAAYRVALAAAQGCRYVQVDAMPPSRPILARLGFDELATTTPFMYPGVSCCPEAV